MLTWDQVNDIAAELGARETTRAKWRQRGVPARWKLEMLDKLRRAGVAVNADIFPTPRKSKRRKAA